ncbi:MAG: type II secretion system F family protein [Planctomycetota bacterium]
MSAFHYQARDRSGQLTAGNLQAPSLDAAAASLRDQGLFPIDLRPGKGKAAKAAKAAKAKHGASGSTAPAPAQAHNTRPSLSAAGASAEPSQSSSKNKTVRGRIKRVEVVAFTHQLAVMIDTGVPISDAMDCIVGQTPNPALQSVLDDVAAVIRGGDGLSVALSAHPRVFPRVMIALVEASEASGGLGVMLERASEYLGKEQAVISKARGAMTYPLVMLGLASVIVVGLVAFILPRFEKLFAAKGDTLPGPTRVLLGASDLVTGQPWLCLGAVVASAVGFWLFRRSDFGRRSLDSLKLSLPVVGPLTRQLFLARSTRMMGTLFASGVPILDVIRLVRKVTRNHRYEQLWDRISNHLERGGQLSDAFDDPDLIPANVRQMVTAGEKSGRLEHVLTKVADFAEEEFDQRVKTATQLLEPAMIVGMGLLVGFLALALLLPVFQASTQTG